ncbi:MAG TPA: VOC family protein [Kofleriaceae bacterium]|jgi:catechol 2,3-dioxygenase-like lactoylglutathione lyase family enzyme
MIDQVATVFVPTQDQDRALAFFVDKLGFTKRRDFPYAGGRWLEVAPTGSTIALALVPGGEGTAPARDDVRCALTTRDIAAAHARLRDLGVDVDPVIGRVGTQRPGLVVAEVVVPDVQPPQVIFRDSEGNRFLLVEVR